MEPQKSESSFVEKVIAIAKSAICLVDFVVAIVLVVSLFSEGFNLAEPNQTMMLLYYFGLANILWFWYELSEYRGGKLIGYMVISAIVLILGVPALYLLRMIAEINEKAGLAILAIYLGNLLPILIMMELLDKLGVIKNPIRWKGKKGRKDA